MMFCRGWKRCASERNQKREAFLVYVLQYWAHFYDSFCDAQFLEGAA